MWKMTSTLLKGSVHPLIQKWRSWCAYPDEPGEVRIPQERQARPTTDNRGDSAGSKVTILICAEKIMFQTVVCNHHSDYWQTVLFWKPLHTARLPLGGCSPEHRAKARQAGSGPIQLQAVSVSGTPQCTSNPGKALRRHKWNCEATACPVMHLWKSNSRQIKRLLLKRAAQRWPDTKPCTQFWLLGSRQHTRWHPVQTAAAATLDKHLSSQLPGCSY